MPEVIPESPKQPLVGIGVMIIKDGKVLLGKRRGAHGVGQFAFPGGHLEHGESIEDCARREIREETGMEVDDLHFQFVSNSLSFRPKHYVHIGLTADWLAGEPLNLEPEKCDGWDWYAPSEIPERLFEFTSQALEVEQDGRTFIDTPSRGRKSGLRRRTGR